MLTEQLIFLRICQSLNLTLRAFCISLKVSVSFITANIPGDQFSPFLIGIPCCIMFLTDWSGIRDGLLCVNAVWIIHPWLSERERRGHFRNQLAMALTMNNWSKLIKVCHDYPSPPQQMKRHTCVCCLFSKSPHSHLPLHQTFFVYPPHCVWRNALHFSTTAC